MWSLIVSIAVYFGARHVLADELEARAGMGPGWRRRALAAIGACAVSWLSAAAIDAAFPSQALSLGSLVGLAVPGTGSLDPAGVQETLKALQDGMK